MENLLTDAISILQEKGYKKPCHPLEALSNTVETNGKIAARKIRFYKWTGLF